MVVPTLAYLTLNHGGPGAKGWAVPMATDIAFAVGVVAVLGSRVAPELRLFLLTLAVVDDVGAVAVIALVYTPSVHMAPLLAAAGMLAVTAAVARSRLVSLPLLVLLGVGVWLAMSRSGVHATLTGVALGLAAPTGEGTVAAHLEHALAPVIPLVVLPLFALANAGVAVGRGSLGGTGAAVAAGVALGLVGGKLVGISGAAWLAVRAGVGALPEGVRWPQLVGVAAVAGVGFTVSIFVADVAFADAHLQAAAKLGILAGSVVAALLGAALLVVTTRSGAAERRSREDTP
jgi:NhaA family Na+:H+ antiporter